MTLNWSPSSKFLASSCHTAWACGCMMGAIHRGAAWWLVLAIFVPFAAAKEFWADLTWLERDTIWGSALDFATYCIGLLLGILGWHYFFIGIIVAICLLIFGMVVDYNLSQIADYD